MAGGNWSLNDQPVLPGLYMNFLSAAGNAIQSGARGIVLAPVKAHWGPIGEVVEIAHEAAITDVFGKDVTGGATAHTTLQLALLGGPKKLLAYRLADDNAKQATLRLNKAGEDGDAILNIKAKYAGERGNSFTITIQDNEFTPEEKELKLLEGTTLLGTVNLGTGEVEQAVSAINATLHKYIVAEKLAEGVLANVAQAALTGGNSGIAGITNADYIAATNVFETEEFHVLTLDGVSDVALRTSLIAWVKRVRKEGKGILLTLGGALAEDLAENAVQNAIERSKVANHEGIINVGTGAKLNGVSYSSAQVAAWVAGLIAGQGLKESTTYAISPFEDVTRRWTRAEQEQAVKQGVFILIHDGLRVKVLRGVNTLTSLAEGKGSSFKKIRKIRVIDQINSDLQRQAEDNYIGKVNNTEEGRLALIEASRQYLQRLASENIIESTGYEVALDPRFYGNTKQFTPDADQVYLTWRADTTDVMEQIFGTFYV